MIDGTDVKLRKKQVIDNIPDVYDYRSLLYVGGHAKHNRHLQLTDEFLKHGYDIDVVEIHKPNVDEMKEKYKWIRHVIHADIRFFQSAMIRSYDVVMFWHGIEHIYKSDLMSLISRMSAYTNELIIFGCPYGIYEQGAEYDNPHEIHISHWYPEELEELFLNISVIGEKDSKKGNILAWKRM